MSEQCLVTGGAGFIGSHLVEALTAQGRKVRVLDDLSTGQTSNLVHVRPAPELVVGDVSDLDTVRRATDGVQLVFHLAALASVQKSVEDPLATHRVCATGTVNVLDAARKAGVRRVVYTGSASAYGLPAGAVQTEAEPLRALSPYAAAKLAGEFYAQSFSAALGLEVATVRFFNVFGPRQRADSPYSGVIALFVDALTSGRAPTVFGDGQQSRDFVYVGDAVQAVIKAADAPGIAGHVYNVGTGRSVTLLELIAVLNKLLGTNVVAKHGPARAGDIRHSRADIARARRDLGYEPAVALEEGLRRTLEWYRQS